ncbi:uncharacterized protein LOC117956459 isoform X1 [Etheostoma cragini]|uniref:uncharacterized protein LOC117956459 isoform X1 n=1 Tax=Etheostoma cragini TaxID=417921 RepID=UPI00155F3CEF|nr:uncharacterized protein LOC117956459 isoform X1 [Etheostoma cragini]
MALHTGEKKYACSFCDKRFTWPQQLKIHQCISQHSQPETGEQPGDSSDPETDDSADWKETREHQSALKSLTHDSRCKKPFRCSECGKSFGNNAHLKRHMITHTGEKPFSCSVCRKSFTQSESLKMHMRTHKGEKPFSCSVCKKSFTQRGNLKCHMKQHTGEKTFSCSVSKISFRLRSHLKHHMKQHTGEEPSTSCVSDITKQQEWSSSVDQEQPENLSQLTTESTLIHTAVSRRNQTSPELGPPTNNGEAQHSSKASDGELSDQDKVPQPELDQMSSDDAEDIPDSEHDDDYDSDASVPLMSGQATAEHIQVKPVKPDVGKSRGSDTGTSVVPSTTKCGPPFKNKMIPNAADASSSADFINHSSKEKPEDEAVTHEPDLVMCKTNFCYICGKPQSKISRHLKTHKTHAEIVHAFSLPEDSKERKILLEKMRNKGNFKHNTAVLQDGTGTLKVKRKPKGQTLAGHFIHCMYCQGMYIRKELWRHVRRCPFKPENEDVDDKPGRTKVLGLAVALESTFSQQILGGVWKLLSVMKQDEVSSVVRNDQCLIQFAHSLYNKHGQDPTKYEYMRQKLREVGRLLLCLRTEFSVHNLEEAVKPANFQRVVQAVKKVSGFDEEKDLYQTPSLALKLGHTLQKIADIIHCRALMAEDEELIRNTDTFKQLYASTWSELVPHRALKTPQDAKYNKPSTLPFTKDVQILHQYLKKAAESAFCSLKEEATTQNYGRLAQLTLAQIIVFNRRRAGEISQMSLRSFYERDNTKLHEDVAMGLSMTEQKLCSYFSRVDITGKMGRKVSVLLTPRVVDALFLLASRRTECGVCATNVFLFARPASMSHYKGQDCLRVHASQCGAKHPGYLRSAQLRKHVATLSQVLHLKTNELEQVADFLGHDIRVHPDFYRLPVPTTHLAKISKLLLSMEKGNLSSMQGRSLDEIEIEDEIVLSDAEDSGSQSDNRNTEVPASAFGTVEPVVFDSATTEQDHDIGGFGSVSFVSSVEESVPPSEGTSKRYKGRGSRRVAKKVWSKAEGAAVMRHFRDHISRGKLATTSECSHCKQVEDPVLAQRTVQNIRDYVRNRGIAAQKQSQKQQI